MKKQFKKTIKSLLVTSILACPISSNARVVNDINGAMTELLGHAPQVSNVFDIEAQGLNKADPAFQPWSGSYWPDILGGIANHYRARSFVGNFVSFLLRYDAAKGRMYGDNQNTIENYNKWDEEELNWRLSPSEKYDLLLGDTNFTLTKAVMDDLNFRAENRKTSVNADGTEFSSAEAYEGDDNTGQFADVQKTYASYDQKVSYKYWKKKGDSIAYWFGICDGWSPAAIYLPRPEHVVRVQGKLGHWIKFYPDDLKALGSYLFARTNNDYMTTMDYHFAGRPCATGGDPDVNDTDSQKPGIVKDFRCNDVDAGVWHLTLANRVGKDKMGFIFEIDNNKKINNHPVAGYEFEYFNPATGETGSLKNSVVARGAVRDAYRFRRHPEAVYLVGVRSKFNYMNYQFAEQHHSDYWDNDREKDDEKKSLTYTYDLELDANGKILGGEWGDRSLEWVEDEDGNSALIAQYADQPDFIWMASPKALPYSEQSIYTSPGTAIDQSNPRPFGNMKWAWDGNGKNLPDDWMRAAQSDAMWQKPEIGELKDIGGGKKDVFPATAKGSTMKSAQPLSNIVYYLFDQARNPNQK